MSYPIRVLDAIRRFWLSIVLGSATGLYVAVAACFALMVLDISGDWRLQETTLAITMDALILIGAIGGGVLGYERRKRRSL